MSTLSIRLPKSVHEQVKALASAEGISMNQFIALAVAEKIAVLQTVNYLEELARRGSREKLLARAGESAGCRTGRICPSLSAVDQINASNLPHAVLIRGPHHGTEQRIKRWSFGYLQGVDVVRIKDDHDSLLLDLLRGFFALLFE